jgi:phage tail protein X
MTDELFYARRKQLMEAVKKAVLALWAHENVVPESIDIPLADGVVRVSVRKLNPASEQQHQDDDQQ